MYCWCNIFYVNLIICFVFIILCEIRLSKTLRPDTKSFSISFKSLDTTTVSFCVITNNYFIIYDVLISRILVTYDIRTSPFTIQTLVLKICILCNLLEDFGHDIHTCSPRPYELAISNLILY